MPHQLSPLSNRLEHTLFGFALKISVIFFPESCPTVSPSAPSFGHPADSDSSDFSHSSSSYTTGHSVRCEALIIM